MNEHPILFNGEMVRAILEGRKTQTRRPITPVPKTDDVNYIRRAWNSPFGTIGDRLWVRETTIISPPNWNDGSDCNIKDDQNRNRIVQWLASYPDTDGASYYGLKKTASIHMPRWASRITLEVTGIYVERLCDISDDDAIAEGILADYGIVSYDCVGGAHREVMGYRYMVSECTEESYETACEAYRELWNSMYEKRGYGWDSNPWVWVCEFKVI